MVGCQTKPTVVKNENANQDKKVRVLADTRSRLSYESFHLPGSIHLNSEDFIITKNRNKFLDPDIVERLARRGVSPEKDVVLISDTPNSVENKKWNWLLLQLDVKDVVMMSLTSYREANKNRVPQAPPERASVWKVEPSVLEKSTSCFVNWSDDICL